MANFYQYYKELPPWAKGVVIVGGVGLVFVVGRPIYAKLFPNADAKNATALQDDAIRDIAKFTKAGLKPSFPDAQFTQYADTIYNAQRTSIGYESGRIKDTLIAMKNDLDVAKLAKAYGVRQDYAFMIPTDKYGLFGAARHGIASDYFGAFSGRIDDVNKDWAKKGITYKL